MANPVIIEVKANTAQAQRSFDGLGASISKFGSSIRNVTTLSAQAVGGIRQIAQGIQNLGFVLSGLIGIPVVAAMSDMTKEILSFERAMVEVQKTTGLASRDIQDLSGDIRELAKQTPTSATELANLAAEAGRVGVGLGKGAREARAEILEFVRVTDMMQVSTTLTGELAAQAFGRFITVFKDLDTSQIEKLGSAINELGQSASVSEDEIVGAMLRIAPAAATLGINAQEVAALATAITQMSESMSRGGTRVRNALEQMAMNAEDAAKLIGISAQEMRKRIDQDALPVFLELVYAINQIESDTERLTVSTEIFGTTGANAVQRFAASFPELEKFINISNDAFEKGTSLQVEFDRALQATTEQLKLLKNNIVEVAMKFAEDLLPIAKEIISALIPAIQDFGEWVAKLGVQQKLLAVAMALVSVAALPLLALLGSIGFAFSMMLSGAINLIGGLMGLVSVIMTFGGSISLLSLLIGGIVAALGVGLVVAVTKALGVFDALLEKLRSVAEGAWDWGENLIANIAEGIVRGAATILTAALEFVGNIISSFLESKSPPETGPLSTINKWGARLIDTYLRGFQNADFGILRKVTSIIRDVFKNMVTIGKMKEIDLGPALAGARTLVSKLIDTFNKTGQIASSVLGEISSMLGDAGDEVVKLITLQLKYNKALRDLETIRQKRTDIQEGYQAEIRAIQNRIDLTGEEKLNLIRQARGRRNIALDVADTEERAAQSTVDALREQVEWQQQYIDALQEQDDIWADHIRVIKSLAKAVKGVGKAIKDVLADLIQQLKINLQTQALYKSKDMDATPLLREELSIRKRIVKELLNRNAAIMALEDPTKEQLAQYDKNLGAIDENLEKIKELEAALELDTKTGGITIPEIDTSTYDEAAKAAEQVFAGVTEAVENLSQTLSRGRGYWEAFIAGITGKAPDIKFDVSRISEFMDPTDLEAIAGTKGLGALDESAQRFYDWGDKIYQVRQRVIGIWESIVSKWESFRAGLSGDVLDEQALAKLDSGAQSLYKIGSLISQALEQIGEAFDTLKEKVSERTANVPDISGWLDAIDAEEFTKAFPSAGATGLGKFFQDTEKLVVPAILGISGAILLLRKPLSGIANLIPVGLIGRNVGRASGKLGELAEASKNLGDTVAFKAGTKINVAMMKITRSVSKHSSQFKRYLLTMGDVASDLGETKFQYLSKDIKWAFEKAVMGPKLFVGKFQRYIAHAKTSGVGFSAVFSDLTRKISEGFRALPGLAKGGFGSLISGFKSVGGLILGFGSSLVSGITSISAFIASVAGIGGAIVAVGLVIAGVVDYIVRNWDKYSQIFMAAFENVKEGVQGFVKSFATALGLAGDGTLDFKAILEKFREIVEPIAKFLSDVLAGAVYLIGGALKEVLPAIGQLLGSLLRGIGIVAGGIVSLLSGIVELIGGLFEAIKTGDWSKFKEGFEKIKQGILAIFGGLATAVLGALSSVGRAIFGFIKSIFDTIAEFAGESKFLSGIIDFVKKVILWFQKLYYSLVGGSIIPDLINGIINWFKKLTAPIKSVFDALKSIFGPVLDKVGDFLQYLKKAFSFIKTAFANRGMAGGLQAIFQAFGPLGKVIAPVLKLFYSLYRIVSPLITAISEGFKEGGIAGAFEALKQVLPGILPMLSGLLGSILTMVPRMLLGLGELFVEKGLPAIGNFITAAYEYLKTNLPIWIGVFLEVLGNLAASIWQWVQEKGIPWVQQFLAIVANLIKTHGPPTLKAFLEALGDLLSAVWEFTTTKLLPWVVEAMKKVGEWLLREGPPALVTFLVALGTLLSKVWEWVINDFLPLVGRWISGAAEYIRAHAPEWWTKIKEILGDIGRGILRWIVTDAIPTVRKLIDKGLEVFKDIKDKWLEKIKEGLEAIKEKFKSTFERIGEIIEQKMKDIINGIIAKVERGINNLIDKINSMIRAVNKVVSAVPGIDPIKEIGRVTIPRLRAGGLVMRPMLALVGDTPGGEAILPLERLESMIGNFVEDKQTGAIINVEINNPVVRNDEDLRRIIDTVRYELGLSMQNKVTGLGRMLA